MRTRLRLREAVPDDLAAIVALVESLGYPVHEAALRRAFELLRMTSEHTAIVAELDGVVCGLLAMSSRPSLALQGEVGAVQEFLGFVVGVVIHWPALPGSASRPYTSNARPGPATYSTPPPQCARRPAAV